MPSNSSSPTFHYNNHIHTIKVDFFGEIICSSVTRPFGRDLSNKPTMVKTKRLLLLLVHHETGTTMLSRRYHEHGHAVLRVSQCSSGLEYTRGRLRVLASLILYITHYPLPIVDNTIHLTLHISHLQLGPCMYLLERTTTDPLRRWFTHRVFVPSCSGSRVI